MNDNYLIVHIEKDIFNKVGSEVFKQRYQKIKPHHEKL